MAQTHTNTNAYDATYRLNRPRAQFSEKNDLPETLYLVIVLQK